MRLLRYAGLSERRFSGCVTAHFFPLIKDETLGLVLHPFDLASNRVLGMCSKDLGYNPQLLLSIARRQQLLPRHQGIDREKCIRRGPQSRDDCTLQDAPARCMFRSGGVGSAEENVGIEKE